MTDDTPYLRAAVLQLSDENAELRQLLEAQRQAVAALVKRLDMLEWQSRTAGYQRRGAA